MAKGKVISSSTMTPVRGGSGHMFGKQSVGTKTPGVTGKADKGGGKYIKGGKSGQVGKQGTSGRVVAGRVSVAKR
jgi:hypothetical protein